MTRQDIKCEMQHCHTGTPQYGVSETGDVFVCYRLPDGDDVLWELSFSGAMVLRVEETTFLGELEECLI